MTSAESASSSGAVRVTEARGGRSEAAMPEHATSAGRSRAFLFAAGPLLWAALILFHPMPTADSPFDGISEVVDRWLIVHVGQLLLTPLLFLAVWRLLDGLSSSAATVSRGALVVWTVFFSAYDSVQGIATGLLARHAAGLPEAEQSAVAGATDYLVRDSRLAGDLSAVQMIAGAAWLTLAVTATVALHHASASKSVVTLTGISVVFAMHMAPAAIGLVALSAAVVIRERQRATTHPASASASASA